MAPQKTPSVDYDNGKTIPTPIGGSGAEIVSSGLRAGKVANSGDEARVSSDRWLAYRLDEPQRRPIQFRCGSGGNCSNEIANTLFENFGWLEFDSLSLTQR